MALSAASDWLLRSACNTYSQFGEDGILQALFEVIGTENKWCLECGAADGLFFSNTRRLIENGWCGVLVEADPGEFKKLQANSARFGGKVFCIHERLGDNTGIDDILQAVPAPPDIDLVVIDVDGQDFYLFNAIFRFRPRVVVIEYCPGDPDFLPPLGGEGQAGINQITKLGCGKLYTPVYCSRTNLIFVRQPLDKLIDEAAARDIRT